MISNTPVTLNIVIYKPWR